MMCSQVRVNLDGARNALWSARERERFTYRAQTNHEKHPARSFGNEEVDSSILSSSTIILNHLALDLWSALRFAGTWSLRRRTHQVQKPSPPMRQPRRFPRPWSVDERAEAFIVRDAGGFAIAHVYFCDNAERRASMIDRMSKDEARRIAVNIMRLPDLLGARNDESPGAEAPGRAVDSGG